MSDDKWMPIESAPVIESLCDDIPDCLVYSPDIGGVRIGRVWRYADGESYGSAHGYNGDWNITHWMPLPEHPAAPTAQGVGE